MPREETLDVIKGLADGFSNQSRQANRFWLATVVAAAVVVFPTVDGTNIKLPFSIANVPSSYYYPIGFGIVFVLFMSYCQAYAQAHNAVKFAHKYIDGLKQSNSKISLRRFFDFSVVSSFARSSPLVELLRSFSEKIPAGLLTVLYISLKSLAHAVILGLPLYALFHAYLRILDSTEHYWIILISFVALVFTFFATTLLVVAELMYGKKVIIQFKERESAS